MHIALSGRALRRAALLATLIVSLSACSHPQPWRLHDVSGLLPPLSFTLTDDNGRPVTAQRYAGKIKVVFFGFTHCDDACPFAMAKLAGVLKNLGKEADDVRVLFISVDPRRDTPQALKAYVASFDPKHMVGLRPSEEELEALAKRYRVSYAPPPPNATGDYEVSHSDALFIFDQKGKARLVATESDSAAAIEADLKRLIEGGAP